MFSCSYVLTDAQRYPSGESVMSGSLVKRDSDALTRARTLLSLSLEERKRFAARAVGERDAEALWSLVDARLRVKGASANTVLSYRKGVLVLLDAWQGVDLLRPRRNDAELFVMNLLAPDRPADPSDNSAPSAGVKPLSAASVRQRVSAAKALYDALRWAEVTTADPFENVPLPKLAAGAVERAKVKAYTQEELEAMAAVCEDWDDRFILLLGAHGGLRVSEMLDLAWEQVDLRNNSLTVSFGKGSKTARVTMSDELVRNLATRAHELSPLRGTVLATRSRSHVYNRVRNLWERSFTLTGQVPPPFTKGVHGLRHYAGVTFARETSDLRKVRDHLRHASMSSTEVYMAAAEDTDEVRAWSIGLDD